MKKFPTSVMGLGGPIEVRLAAKLKVKKDKVAGSWHAYKRLIEIDSTLPEHEQWKTLYHEIMHAALDDSGQHQLLSAEGQEALCDLVGTMRMREEDGE